MVPKELRQDAPILRVLGRTHVPLEPLVAGEPTVSTVVNLGVIRTVETDRTTYMRVQQPPLIPTWVDLATQGETQGLGWMAAKGHLLGPPQPPST